MSERDGVVGCELWIESIGDVPLISSGDWQGGNLGEAASGALLFCCVSCRLFQSIRCVRCWAATMDLQHTHTLH